MPAERATWAGAKTWLLAAVAGWSLAIWALGLFGLGGRIDPLPEDATLVQRLPQPPPPGAERLGPIGQYAEIGARPLFADDRRPHPFFIDPQGEEAVEGGFEFILTSVLLTPRMSMAILQPGEGGESVRLKLGEAPEGSPGWTLAAIEPRAAVFNGPEGERRLELRVFDGVGGEPPTEMAEASPQPADGRGAGAAARRRAAGIARPGQAPVPVAAPAQAPQRAAEAPVHPPEAPTPTPPTEPTDVADDPTTEAQAEAIRQRIEARREQLRQQSQNAPPEQTP